MDSENSLEETTTDNISSGMQSRDENLGIDSEINSCTEFNLEKTNLKVMEVEKNWAELPSFAIENIYTFLSRKDQSRMSQVCSRWSKEFHSPSLWTTMQFILPEQEYSSEVYPEVRFARKYGSMFRHVEIITKRIKISMIGAIWKQLWWFLQELKSSSQLDSIKFIDLGRYLRHLTSTLYNELIRAIISFFNSQKNLKTVTFRDSRFSREEGTNILRAIFHSESSTIINLTLRNFVNEIPFTVHNPQYASNVSVVCEKFATVRSLEVDYSLIFEDLMLSLHEKLSSGEYQLDKKKAKLSSLSIFCDGKKHSNFRGINPGIWKSLSKVLTDMKVTMEIEIHSNLTRELEKFLVREIPLKQLDFTCENIRASSRIGMSAMLTHLLNCKYQDCLEGLSIFWMAAGPDCSRSAISFIQSCKKLRSVFLRAECVTLGIENTLQSLLQNHPEPLERIVIWSNKLYEEESRIISEQYYERFKAEGILCSLIGDRRLRRRQ